VMRLWFRPEPLALARAMSRFPVNARHLRCFAQA